MLNQIIFKEKNAYNYIYVNPTDGELYLLLPVVSGETIALDNTCQTFHALNVFLGKVVAPGAPSGLQSINNYIQDLEADLEALKIFDYNSLPQSAMKLIKEKTLKLMDLIEYRKMMQALCAQIPLLGTSSQYPHGINALMQGEDSNIFGFLLSPSLRDAYIKIQNPGFSLRRASAVNSQIPDGLGKSLRQTLMLRLSVEARSKKDRALLSFREKIRGIRGSSESLTEEHITQFKEALSGVILETLNENIEISIDAKTPFDLDYVRGTYYIESFQEFDENLSEIFDQLVSADLLRKGSTSLFDDVSEDSIGSRSLYIERVSIMIQFFVGEVQLYCKDNNLSSVNFGAILDMPENREEFSGCIVNALNASDAENAIIKYINKNLSNFGLSAPINSEGIQNIKHRFREDFTTVQGSPHFDEFLLLGSAKGRFKTHRSYIVCGAADFLDAHYISASLKENNKFIKRKIERLHAIEQLQRNVLNPKNEVTPKLTLKCLPAVLPVGPFLSISEFEYELLCGIAEEQNPDCLKEYDAETKLGAALSVILDSPIDQLKIFYKEGKYVFYTDEQSCSTVRDQLNRRFDSFVSSERLVKVVIDTEAILDLDHALSMQYDKKSPLYIAVHAIENRQKRVEEMMRLLLISSHNLAPIANGNFSVYVPKEKETMINILGQQRRAFEADNAALPRDVLLSKEHAAALYKEVERVFSKNPVIMKEMNAVNGMKNTSRNPAKIRRALSLLEISYESIRVNSNNGFIINIPKESMDTISLLYDRHAEAILESKEGILSEDQFRREHDSNNDPNSEIIVPRKTPLSMNNEKFHIDTEYAIRIYKAVAAIYGTDNELYKKMNEKNNLGWRPDKMIEALKLLGSDIEYSPHIESEIVVRLTMDGYDIKTTPAKLLKLETLVDRFSPIAVVTPAKPLEMIHGVSDDPEVLEQGSPSPTVDALENQEQTPLPQYRWLISDGTRKAILAYRDKVLANRDVAGDRLFKQLALMESKNLDFHTEEGFISALINTKKHRIFAESQWSRTDFDGGKRWFTDDEFSLLGGINCSVPVSIYDTGNWFDSRLEKQHNPPIQGRLLFTPGVMLNNVAGNSPDRIKCLNTNGDINQEAYARLVKDRLLSIFAEANAQAQQNGHRALVVLPAIGCGVFASSDTAGQEQARAAFTSAVKEILSGHHQSFSAISGVFIDLFDQSVDTCLRFGNIPCVTFSSANLRSSRYGCSQLSDPSTYRLLDDSTVEFQDCTLYKVVAWDHLSWPTNDYMSGNDRNTDDGVVGGATSVCGVMTGVSGAYNDSGQVKSIKAVKNVQTNKFNYYPPQGYSDWTDVAKKHDVLLVATMQNIMIVDSGAGIVHGAPLPPVSMGHSVSASPTPDFINDTDTDTDTDPVPAPARAVLSEQTDVIPSAPARSGLEMTLRYLGFIPVAVGTFFALIGAAIAAVFGSRGPNSYWNRTIEWTIDFYRQTLTPADTSSVSTTHMPSQYFDSELNILKDEHGPEEGQRAGAASPVSEDEPPASGPSFR